MEDNIKKVELENTDKEIENIENEDSDLEFETSKEKETEKIENLEPNLEPNDEKGEDDKLNIFNHEDMDFDEPEIKFDTTPYEEFKEKGLSIEDPNFHKNVELLQECGLKDPEQIGNFLLKMQEKAKAMYSKTPEEIKKDLIKNLTKEEKENYKAIGNMFKNIFKGDQEALALIDRDVMSDPQIIRMINLVRNYYIGNGKNPEPKNSANQLQKSTNATSFDDGVSEVNKLVAEKLRLNKNITKNEKQKIITEVRAKIKSTDLSRFDNYFK